MTSLPGHFRSISTPPLPPPPPRNPPPKQTKQVCHTCTPGHPYSRFAWGNLQSLRDEPAAAGVDINAELRAFHEQFYVASVRFGFDLWGRFGVVVLVWFVLLLLVGGGEG